MSHDLPSKETELLKLAMQYLELVKVASSFSEVEMLLEDHQKKHDRIVKKYESEHGTTGARDQHP